MPAPKSWKLVAIVGAVLAVAAAAGAARVGKHGPGPSSGDGDVGRALPKAASETELALIAPLRPGSAFEGWRVAAVDAVAGGTMRVELRRDRTEMALDVALAGGPVVPPASAGAYAVYYNAPPDLAVEAERVAKALAELVGKHGGAPPAGMGTFTPTTRPSDVL